MLAIQQEAIRKYQVSVQRSKEYFDRKFVKKMQPHNFFGDIILNIIKKRIKDIKMLGYNGLAHVPLFMKDPVNCMTSNTNVRVVQLNI